MEQLSDLDVQSVSQSLQNISIDLIISGSIGATESIKFIRALRRLGATVQPWATQGALQFITPTAIEWASDRDLRTEFSGRNSHIGQADLCLVVPASASIIAQIARGETHTVSSALALSYLGQDKPVFILPNMHQSFSNSAPIAKNLATLSDDSHSCKLLTPRVEEGKIKYPSPDRLADEVSHLFCFNQKKILTTLGSCRAYIDDVRFVTNFSTGTLGTKICRELYRQGFYTIAVCGPGSVYPSGVSEVIHVETNADYQRVIEEKTYDGFIGCAAILDFIPKEKITGKISSQDKMPAIKWLPTKKLLSAAKPTSNIKVGFKLETKKDLAAQTKIAKKYIERDDLSLFILNFMNQTNDTSHLSYFFDKKIEPYKVEGKTNIASSIVKHIKRQLKLTTSSLQDVVS